MTGPLHILLDLNLTMVLLFLAFKLFFERDKNFLVRRIFLLGVAVIPLLLLLVPDSLTSPVAERAPLHFRLEELTITATAGSGAVSGTLSWMQWITRAYLAVVVLGLSFLLIQLGRIAAVAFRAPRLQVQGQRVLASKEFHASSFFGFVFMDPDRLGEDNCGHILAHERVHCRQGHSLDRLLVEVLVVLNWFNPVVWLYRKAVIVNLEYLADSAVLRHGHDPVTYQLSILNQYLGSASLIHNQFSNQIKNRIDMLHKNYKMGSHWKLLLVLPLIAAAFVVVSCSKSAPEDQDAPAVDPAQSQALKDLSASLGDDVAEEVFFVVEEMPKFNGDDTGQEFRKYMAYHITYPAEAIEAGVEGKVFVKFVVDSKGRVVVPDQKMLAAIEDVPMEEVVCVAYQRTDETKPMPEQKYIDLLKAEVVRVIESSPAWEPGHQRGKAVNVMFTFPMNFQLD
ncbi:MAG: M56 family metallopeptidase [Bacteroidales bacterium]